MCTELRGRKELRDEEALDCMVDVIWKSGRENKKR